MNIEDFKLNMEYTYEQIYKADNILVEECGLDSNIIGTEFIVARSSNDNDDSDLVVSFVLIAMRGKSMLYKCIYSDYSK